MAPPALGALDVVVVAASTTTMVLCPLHRKDVMTAATVPPAMVPRPLHLDDVVVVVVEMAKPPLLERLCAASESAFRFVAFHFIGMVMRINAELLMLSQKWKNEGIVMELKLVVAEGWGRWTVFSEVFLLKLLLVTYKKSYHHLVMVFKG